MDSRFTRIPRWELESMISESAEVSRNIHRVRLRYCQSCVMPAVRLSSLSADMDYTGRG